MRSDSFTDIAERVCKVHTRRPDSATTRHSMSSFRPAMDFDPTLIVGQIAALQTLLYIDLGVWMLVLNGLAGRSVTTIGLELFFSYRSIRLSYTGGWISFAAFFLNALAGGCFLCIIVERAKKCLDFASTAHFVHLCCCTMYDGLPSSWEWWAVNFMSLIVMSLLGEYLCMRREMRDIPLFSGYQKQSSSV